MMVTQEILKDMFDYNPETGTLISIFGNNRVGVGGSVGSNTKGGYLATSIDFKTYMVHRLIWLYVHGVWPDQIDHINHDRKDNRICNLRSVSSKDNNKNRSMTVINTSGVIGVSWIDETQKWRATIMIDGKNVGLGSFSDKQDAINARKKANVLHGFHENHGRKL